MKAEDISGAVAKISDAAKEAGTGFEALMEAHKAFVEAFFNCLIESLNACAMFIETRHEIGNGDLSEFIRNLPVKRIYARWRIRRNARRCCAQCYRRADCGIKSLLLKGRLE